MTSNISRSGLFDYTDHPEKLNKLAESSLSKFGEISSAANEKLKTYQREDDGSVFASRGDASRASGSLNAIKSTIQNEYKKIVDEPAIARVVIQHEDTKKVEIFYVCRSAPPSGIKNVLSYRSPLGRLAALEVGETYDLGEETGLRRYDEQDIFKVQHARYTPEWNGEAWDSRKTEYRDASSKKSITINSLLRLLEGVADTSEDPLARLLAADSQKENILQGVRRDIVEKLSLRDQPILDQYQDDIFRLPLQYSLLLLGPAGSGKTTTLIRRLGQKLDIESGLTEEERSLVKNLSDANKPHNTSWLMFTPTELLKSYLKEAFNREGIPAPDRNISTWDDFRYDLGKNIFKILYTPNFKSGFQYDPNTLTLIDGANDSTDIYNDFYAWMIADYAKELISTLEGRTTVGRLKDNKTLSDALNIAKKHLEDEKRILLFFRSMLDHKSEITRLNSGVVQEISTLMDQELRRELNANQNFLYEFSSILKSLTHEEDESNDDQDDTIAAIFDTEETSSETDLKKAQAAYRRVLLSLAQKTNENSKKTKSVQISALLKWLGERTPNDSVLSHLRSLAAEAKILSTLNKPLNSFFRSINSRYRKFRRLRQAENTWYNPDSALYKKIDATEFDVLTLTNLRVSYELLSSSDIFRNTSDSWLSILKPIKNHYVNQVLVDEAPDFSPLQLGCMKLLSHPQINSFFACGDFNQRLVSTGTKELDDLKNFLPGKTVEIRKINTPYRQSKRLYDFSLDVLKMIGAEAIESAPPKSMGTLERFSPILGERLKDAPLAEWIAERIVEIEEFLTLMPSIAILVPEEEYVRPIAQELQKALSERTSAIVQPCYEGQSKGNEKAIRVFDIKHIKGLEFEAAFFVALDKLESLYPELMGNYLYVGATRAATFLGVSYEHTLPTSVEIGLRQCFVSAWPRAGQDSSEPDGNE